VSHKTLHPGLMSLQPSGLATPEACLDISPGLSERSERNPGYGIDVTIAPRKGCGAHLPETNPPNPLSMS